MSVPAKCDWTDQTTSTLVTLPLVSASGMKGSLELGTTLAPGQGWELTARAYACPAR
jgi:hypothetical protein